MSVKTGKQKIYWDSCVFIAWLMDEKDWPEDIRDGILDTVYDLEQRKILLLTSAITRTEIFNLTPERTQKYDLLMQRRDLHEIAADARVANRASSIREYYKRRDVSIRTPDAIHLATAIIYQADELHTLDGKEKKGLIRFNGNVADSPLKIVLPYPRNKPPLIGALNA